MKNFLPIKNSLALRLLKVVFSIYLCITVVVTLMQMANEYLLEERSVKNSLIVSQAIFQGNLVASVWNIDVEQIPIIADGILKQPIIVGIVIDDKSHNTSLKKGKILNAENLPIELENNQEIPLSPYTRLFQHSFSLVHDKEDIATVTLYSSNQVIFDKVKYNFLAIIVNAIIKTVALWLLFIWAFNKYLTRQLDVFCHAMEKVDLDNQKSSLLNLETFNTYELSRIEFFFNDLLQRIIESQNKLNELNRTLEQKVAERTQKLVESEKMAALGQLIAGVAHEINNPVNFLQLGMYNVKEGIDKQKQFILPLLDEEPDIVAILQPQYQQIERALENIEEGCSRIKTIVEDLRTFSRLDEADRKVVNLIDSLKATIRITQTQYKKHVQITTNFQAQPELECWPAKLNQVFMNIIVNACHAIEKQQEVNFSMAGLLSISSFETQQADGKKLALAFQDNGCGMTGETKNKIFDPFFTTKPLGQGTGLGMSISYSIIQEHKGHIQIESELGQGTKITLYLPLSA